MQGAVNKKEIEGEKLTRYIESCIKSKTTYLNFDIGGFRKEKPLSTKLYYLLEGKIKECIKDGSIRDIVRLIDGFVERNSSSIRMNFEQADNMELTAVWNQIKLILDATKQDEKVIEKLLSILKAITLEHLLLVFFLWEFAFLIVKKPEKKRNYYIC